MPTTYKQTVRDQWEQHYREDSHVLAVNVLRQDSVALDIVLDSRYTSSDKVNFVNLSFLFDPFNPLGAEVRSVKWWSPGAFVLDAPLSRLPVAGDVYALCNNAVSGLDWLLNLEIQPSLSELTAGPANFFAGAVLIASEQIPANPLAIAPVTMQIDAVFLDVSGFTNGAVLTYTAERQSLAGAPKGTVTTTFTKDANNNLLAFLPGNPPPPLSPLGNYRIGPDDKINLYLQSNNAGDVAVSVPITVIVRLA